MMDAFGAQVTRHRIRYCLQAVGRRTVDLQTYLDNARANGDRLFDELLGVPPLNDPAQVPGSYPLLMRDQDAVRNLCEANPAEAVNQLTGMLDKLCSDLRHFFTEALDTHVYAIQRPEGRGGPPTLKSWLVGPGEVFREHVLERSPRGATILTSATLAVGRTFDYPRGRLGFDEFAGRVQEFTGREIFDYRHNALAYVADDLPAPKGADVERHIHGVFERSAELVRLSQGRALILLASHKVLRTFIDGGFSTKVAGYTVHYQSRDGTPGQLTTCLRETPGGVVVGTRSFWEGVDVPGENLSLVVIDKTPFPVPTDPLIEKLTDLAENAGGNGFMDVSIPNVQVAVQQEAGRLIRTDSDRGVIALLDPRGAVSMWGRLILRALPRDMPHTTDITDVAAFFGRCPRAGGPKAA
jgi:ATP-dependent DNA helicase DinG